MSQPPGFVDPLTPHYLCKLHESLYGLKQVPRAWFENFTTHFSTYKFITSPADPSLFVRSVKGSLTILLCMLMISLLLVMIHHTSLLLSLSFIILLK